MVIAIYRATTRKHLIVIDSVDIQREKYSLLPIAINFFRLKFAERSQRKINRAADKTSKKSEQQKNIKKITETIYL